MDIDVSKLSTQSRTPVNRLFVIVYLSSSPEKPSFKGFVKSISSFDVKGPFDVLPQHENFVTQFGRELKLVTEEGEKVSYPVKDGVLEVANNIARAFLAK